MKLLMLVAGVLLLPLVFAYLGAALLALWVYLRERTNGGPHASPSAHNLSTHR